MMTSPPQRVHARASGTSPWAYTQVPELGFSFRSDEIEWLRKANGRVSFCGPGRKLILWVIRIGTPAHVPTRCRTPPVLDCGLAQHERQSAAFTGDESRGSFGALDDWRGTCQSRANSRSQASEPENSHHHHHHSTTTTTDAVSTSFLDIGVRWSVLRSEFSTPTRVKRRRSGAECVPLLEWSSRSISNNSRR